LKHTSVKLFCTDDVHPPIQVKSKKDKRLQYLTILF